MHSFFQIDDKLNNPFFIGTVEDNYDPTFNYRVKVRIENLHPESISTDKLPWASRVDSSFMGVSESNSLKHAIPEKGSKVLILAIGNNLNSLIYLGSLYHNTSNTPKDKNYLDTYGIYNTDGQFIGVDKIQKFFNMLFIGTINIDKVLDINTNVKNSINTTCTTYNIKSNTLNIKENDININTENEKLKVGNLLEVNTGTMIKVNSGAAIDIKSPITTINGCLTVSTGASGMFIAGGHTVTVSSGIVTNIS